MSGFSLPGTFFDGETAGAKKVRGFLNDAEGVLRIKDASNTDLAVWQVEDLRQIKDPGYGDGTVFQIAGNDDARFIVDRAEDARALVASVPSATKTDIPKGTFRKVVLWTGGAIGSVLLILFVILPNLADTMAAMIPPAREEAIGETIVAQIQRSFGSELTEAISFCEDPKGQAALDKMTDRLVAGLDLPYPMKVKVLRHPMINAFAAPGGHVVFMNGLIKSAETPEEVAGVLAHEIGHVAARDPLRMALRAAGSAGIVSMVIGDFAGGALVVIMTEWIMSASYSREAEAQADVFAHELLAEAGLPTSGLADFFDKLIDKYGDADIMPEVLSTHPNLASRAEAARDADTRTIPGDFRPILTDEEWADLQAICDASPSEPKAEAEGDDT